MLFPLSIGRNVVLVVKLAAILDFRVMPRSNQVNTYFNGFPMVQNMGVKPIIQFLSHIIAELWSF